MNLSSNRHDIRFIINRRLPELANERDLSHGRVRLRMEEEDGRRVVNVLSAAFRQGSKDGATLLTITMNSQKLYGVGNLFNAIDHGAENMNERRRNKKEGAMTLYLRLWGRTTQFFIQYHEMTQKPSGSIKNLFARYDFQTTKKNVRDLHIVLWTHESNHDFNIRHTICGSSSHLFNDLEAEFNRHDSFISSEGHLTQLIEDSTTLIMHSCKNSGFRCHKKATVLVIL